ncbi:MAG: hypothetical protein M1833_005214 [Piccolia ochrophora]|nr:MAG: hypothetical protein M1833_005214 [Piccolia ochrophora]
MSYRRDFHDNGYVIDNTSPFGASPYALSPAMTTATTPSSSSSSNYETHSIEPEYVRAVDSAHAPIGFPPGFYTLIRQGHEPPYWLLNPCYRYDSRLPQTIATTPPREGRGRRDSTGGFTCLYPHCDSRTVFSRKADMHRHYRTRHYDADEKTDCPMRCAQRRTGDNGFTRKDHLQEHLRKYHVLKGRGFEKAMEKVDGAF